MDPYQQQSAQYTAYGQQYQGFTAPQQGTATAPYYAAYQSGYQQQAYGVYPAAGYTTGQTPMAAAATAYPTVGYTGQTAMMNPQTVAPASTVQGNAAATNPLSAEQKKYTEQFQQWQKQYDEWLKQNKDHPDQKQFQQWQQQMKTWQEQFTQALPTAQTTGAGPATHQQPTTSSQAAVQPQIGPQVIPSHLQGNVHSAETTPQANLAQQYQMQAQPMMQNMAYMQQQYMVQQPSNITQSVQYQHLQQQQQQNVTQTAQYQNLQQQQASQYQNQQQQQPTNMAQPTQYQNIQQQQSFNQNPQYQSVKQSPSVDGYSGATTTGGQAGMNQDQVGYQGQNTGYTSDQYDRSYDDGSQYDQYQSTQFNNRPPLGGMRPFKPQGQHPDFQPRTPQQGNFQRPQGGQPLRGGLQNRGAPPNRPRGFTPRGGGQGFGGQRFERPQRPQNPGIRPLLSQNVEPPYDMEGGDESPRFRGSDMNEDQGETRFKPQQQQSRFRPPPQQQAMGLRPRFGQQNQQRPRTESFQQRPRFGQQQQGTRMTSQQNQRFPRPQGQQGPQMRTPQNQGGQQPRLRMATQGQRMSTPQNQGQRMSTPQNQGGQQPRPQMSTPQNQGSRMSTPQSQGQRMNTPQSQGQRMSTPQSQGQRMNTPQNQGQRMNTPQNQGGQQPRPRMSTPQNQGQRMSTPQSQGQRISTPQGQRISTPQNQGGQQPRPRMSTPQNQGSRMSTPQGQRMSTPQGQRMSTPQNQGPRMQLRGGLSGQNQRPRAPNVQDSQTRGPRPRLNVPPQSAPKLQPNTSPSKTFRMKTMFVQQTPPQDNETTNTSVLAKTTTTTITTITDVITQQQSQTKPVEQAVKTTNEATQLNSTIPKSATATSTLATQPIKKEDEKHSLGKPNVSGNEKAQDVTRSTKITGQTTKSNVTTKEPLKRSNDNGQSKNISTAIEIEVLRKQQEQLNKLKELGMLQKTRKEVDKKLEGVTLDKKIDSKVVDVVTTTTTITAGITTPGNITTGVGMTDKPPGQPITTDKVFKPGQIIDRRPAHVKTEAQLLPKNHTACPLFPNCTIAEECEYHHPYCRYDERCRRADCRFFHTVPITARLSGKTFRPVQDDERFIDDQRDYPPDYRPEFGDRDGLDMERRDIVISTPDGYYDKEQDDYNRDLRLDLEYRDEYDRDYPPPCDLDDFDRRRYGDEPRDRLLWPRELEPRGYDMRDDRLSPSCDYDVYRDGRRDPEMYERDRGPPERYLERDYPERGFEPAFNDAPYFERDRRDVEFDRRRGPYNDPYYNDEPTFGGRRPLQPPFDDRPPPPFDDRPLPPCDDRPPPQFDDRLPPPFDDRLPHPPFDDRARPPFDDRLRPPFDDRAHPPFDDRAHPPFDDRAHPPFDDRPHPADYYDRCPGPGFHDDGVRRPRDFRRFPEERDRHHHERDTPRKSYDYNHGDNREGSRDVPEKPKPKPKTVAVDTLLDAPGRDKRPDRIVFIFRGLPGSGKTHIARLIKEKEASFGAPTPRILSLDDYFLQETVKREKDPETGKNVELKSTEYIYEEELEDSYRNSLFKSFNKTLDDGFFPMVMLDCVNDKVEHFDRFWSQAKQKGFEVYIAEITTDPADCAKRNTHNRTLEEINALLERWEETPFHHTRLDVRSLLQAAAITEVEMEAIEEPGASNEESTDKKDDDDEDEQEEELAKSRWDDIGTELQLAKLDGLRIRSGKRKAHGESPPLDEEEDDPYDEREEDMRLGKKRVRWADIEERKHLEHRRKIGFCIGTDWSLFTNPNAEIPK